MSEEISQVQSRKSLHRLIIFLVLLSIVIMVGRQWVFGGQQVASDDRLWHLSIDLTVAAIAKDTAVQIYPPQDTAQLRVVQRSLQHSGFRIRNWSEENEARRSILAFATENVRQSIVSDFWILQSGSEQSHSVNKKKPLKTEEREKYLQDSDVLQLQNTLLNKRLQKLVNGQLDSKARVEKIFKYVQGFTKIRSKNDLHVPTTLAKRRATNLDQSLAMLALCRAANIPARIVAGIIVREDIDTGPHYWLEVYLEDSWQAYDVTYGYQETVPGNYLPLRHNSVDITQVLNGETLKLEFDLEREYDHPYLRKKTSRSIISIFDLTHLPLDSRLELSLLLLLPLGALITAFFRHVIGLHSYGVFTPTLLALALVYADKLLTVVILIVVCSLAIAGRGVFPATISRIPRLAIIFTLIAMMMALSVSALDYFDLSSAGKVILLPIIILTSMVDRLYRTLEDSGFHIAMHRLLWTIVITLICLPIVQFEQLGNLLVIYPEAHFTTLAIFLLISIYKGKQLIKLPGLTFLAEPKNSGKGKKTKKSSDPAAADK